MRICIIGLAGSIHTYKILKWFVEKGHEVHLVSRATHFPEGVIFDDFDFRTFYGNRFKRYCSLQINIYSVKNLRAVLVLRSLLKRIKPDVLYSYSLLNKYPGYLGVFSGFHPFVVTPLNGDVLWAPDKNFKPKKSFIQKLLLKYVIWRADVLTASAEIMKESWIRLGADAKKIIMVVDPGTDLQYFHPQEKSHQLRESLGLQDAPVVLSTRSLADYYNIDIIVESIPLVLKEVPDAKFVFIWHSASKQQVDKLNSIVRKLNIEDSLRLVGTIKDYLFTLPKYYNMADVFVSLSGCDTVPNSLLEAMACGTAPVCAKLPAIEEYIRDGWNGFVVPQRDRIAAAQAIIQLLKDKTLGKTFAERNLPIVKEKAEFNKQMEKLENAFRTLSKK